MSGEVTVTAARARLAALVKHGSDPAVVDQARTDLAAGNIRKAIAAQRAASGLPPAANDLEAVGYVACLLTKGAA
jgi:hypothetical protein